MSAKIQQMIESASKRADQAAQEWLKGQEKDIANTVHSMLDKRLEKIVSQHMGFDSSWSVWEVDHCNGRSGESAAGDWLRERSGEAAKQWLTKQAGNLPDLPKQAIASLRAQYLRSLESAIREQLRKRAVSDAEQAVEKIIADLDAPVAA